MNYIDRIMGMFINPVGSMKDVVKDPRIEEALVIVGIYAIFSMVKSYVQTSHIQMVYNIAGADQTGLIQSIGVVMSLVFGFISPLICWPIITGILHAFSLMFGGEGKFYPQMMTAVGYTTIVKIVTVVIGILLLTQAPVVTMVISEQNALASTQSVTSAFYSSPYYVAATLVMMLGVVWSSLICVFAIKEGEKLSLASSAIVVGVPLVVYILFTYGTSLILGMLNV